MTPLDLAQLRQRAATGDAEALAFTAMLAALGAWEPQSWTAALQRLGSAARLGSVSAREQLCVLADIEMSGKESWTDLAASIDLGAWTAAAAKTRLLPDPRISAAPAFLSPRACAWLIERARGRVAQAKVFDPETGLGRIENARSNSAFEFTLADLDVVVVAVRARIAATVGTVTGALEPVQILHYAPGQRFERHYDFLDADKPGFAVEVARIGQRVVTFLVYLNAGFEGGETEFPIIGLVHKGQAGDALMFANVDRAGAPDRRTLHAGLPPGPGEKWILSQWIRDRAPA
jgi:prolyl 4-hydroxylase